MSSRSACLVCGSRDLTPVIELNRIPIQCSSLIPTRAEALNADVGDIRLVFCGECGHLFNAAYNPDLVKYDGDYENSLDCSPSFAEYLELIARSLCERYQLTGKRVLEIGCGQGGFLKLFSRLGAKQASGFDPSYIDPVSGEAPGVDIFRKPFTDDCIDGPVDLLCCRHTLEHITDPVGFLAVIAKAYADIGLPPIYFEVPNAAATLERNAVWDIIYPHVSYFSAKSLSTAFRKSGIRPGRVYDAFGGQFLCLETRARDANGPALSDLAAAAKAFSEHYGRMVKFWKSSLAEMEARGSRTVIWGSGAKAVSFLNAVGRNGAIEFVVDINPRKQGKFIPGAGQEIVGPEFLSGYQPGTVVVMNPIYTSEVQTTLEALGLRCDVLTADVFARGVGAAN